MTAQPTRDQLLDMTEDLRVLGDRPELCDEVVDGLWAALDQAEAERDWNLRSSRRAKEQRIKANARADQAEARIQAVRELHVATGPSGVICNACNVVTPCPTIRVLDSDGDPGQSCGRGPCALGYGHPGACRC